MSSLSECRSKWGEHPEWSPYCSAVYGEIVKVNNDGSINVRLDKWSEEETIIENINMFHIPFWDKDREENIIRRRKSQLKEGAWVKIQEYRNLWYLYVWEKKYSFPYPDKCEVKYVFKHGKPEYGYKQQFRICDVYSDKENCDYWRFRLYDY